MTSTYLLVFLLALCTSSRYYNVNGEDTEPEVEKYVGEVVLVSGESHSLGPKLNKENALANEYSQPVVAVDGYGNIIVGDSGIIRNISSGGNSNVTVLAGNPSQTGYRDGSAADSLIVGVVRGITTTMKDGHPVVYFTDSKYIRKIEEGMVSTFVSTDLGTPHGVAVDKEGNIYVADTATSQVYKYGADGKRKGNYSVASPTNLVINPEGSKLYITWSVQNVLELTTSFVIQDRYLEAGSPVKGIAFGENGQLFYSTENGFFLYIDKKSITLVAGSGSSNGFRDGDYPAPNDTAPVFSGIYSVASKSEYEFVFSESSAYYDVRVISVYPHNKSISWIVDVNVTDIPYTNASVFDKIQDDALEDIKTALGVDITQPNKGVAGTPTSEYVPMAFTLQAYARNYSSRRTVASSGWPLVTAATKEHNRNINVSLYLPIKDMPLNNETMMQLIAQTVAEDLRDLTQAGDGARIAVQNSSYHTVAGAVIFNLTAPNPLMNETTQALLERPYPDSYPKTNKLVEDYHKYRPLGLYFPAELVPKNNASIMKEVTELIQQALAEATGTPASNFPFTATGGDLVKDLTTYDDHGVGTRYAVINGMIRGPIENATTTEILQNETTFANVFEYLKKFNSPRRMGISFGSGFGLPVCCKGPMVESTDAFKQDLETLLGSSGFTMNKPPFVINEDTNTTTYSADIPGGFENKSTSERLGKFKWPALTAFVSQPQKKTVTLKGPHSRWPLQDKEKMKRVRELLVEDAGDYYGYHGPHILLDPPTPTLNNDTGDVSWTFALPKNGIDLDRNLSNSTFPKTNNYLNGLQPNERALETERSAPEFFSGSCGKGCVIGIAVACAIVLAVIVVIIVLVVSKRKRRSNVVAPSFDPTINPKTELE